MSRTHGATKALRLRADCHVEIFEPDHVLLFTERGHQVLRGKAFTALIPLIDGTRDADELARAVSDRIAFAEAYYALSYLETQGLTRAAADQAGNPAATAWFDSTDVAPSRLESARLAIATTGAGDAGLLRAALSTLPVDIVRTDADLLIVVAGDYLDPELETLNAACHAEGQPWLLARTDGTRAWIGPVFSPASGCWACLASRLREARQAETWLAGLKNGEPILAPSAFTTTTRNAAAGLVAVETMRWLGGTDAARAQLTDELLRIDTRTMVIERHRFSRRPQCRVCGSPDATLPASIALDPAQQPLRDDGNGSALDHFIDPMTGVVHAVVDGLPSDNPLVHTAIAKHYFPMFKDDVQVLQKNLLGRSGGKATTADLAHIGAIGEALERYSGVWQGDCEPVLRGTVRTLGVETIDLNACLGFSAAQFAGRAEWNRQLRSPHQVVPVPLDPEMEIDWSPAHSLTTGRTVYVPAAYCWYGHPELDSLFCLADSNGCAGGQTLERAILSGLIELIERDAVAIWWYNRVARPDVDLRSFANSYIADLCRLYDALGRTVWAIDVSTDLGVPVFVALSARREGAVEDIVFGFGADLDAGRALVGALTEMNQSYGFVSERGGDGATRYRAENGEMLAWFRTATRANEPWLMPMPDAPVRPATGYPPCPWSDVVSAIHGLVARLSESGLEVLAIDQTRPDLDAPVARVIVPGLRHMWRRLGPGRLYDVPVQLGWRQTPLAECDCNPYSIFI